jgi:signal transduction histidine kinase
MVVLAMFILAAGAISTLSARLRFAQRLLESAAEDLSERNAQLEDAAVESEQLAEEAQRRAEEAQAANRAKADFLGAMSHETRQPLNASLAFLQLLEMGTYGTLSEEQHVALDKVKRNQQQLLSIITDILTFARLEAGRVSLQTQALRAADILHDLPAAVEPQIMSHSLTLDIETCDPALRLFADPDRIHQICVNLLTNAIRATGPGGRIGVRCVGAGDVVRIEVSDTGVGVPGDKLDRIFEPFVQLDRALNRPKEGVGLGLAISRDLARAMSGDLSARSVVGQGSVFTLTLPAAH